MEPQAQLTHQPTVFMLSCSQQGHIHYKNQIFYGHIITAGELVVKAKYLCSMQIDTNWYCNQQPKHHVITVPTRKILHPQLEVNAVTYFHATTKSVCTRKQLRSG